MTSIYNGIEKYIKFPRHLDKSVTKMKMQEILNKSVLVTDWDIRKSRFIDNDGVYASICGEFMDSGQKWMVNTGSHVIIEQLMEIDKAQIDNEESREFACCFSKIDKIYKMTPISKENE